MSSGSIGHIILLSQHLIKTLDSAKAARQLIRTLMWSPAAPFAVSLWNSQTCPWAAL